MARVDLTVRGAGILGLSIAWEAARRGAKVRVIDVARVGAGASGGVVGALSPHVPEQWNAKKAFQLDSLLMAQNWWAGVEAATGLSSGYGRTGRLQPLACERAVAQAQVRAIEAADLWRGQAEWRVIPATAGAWEPASPSGFLIEDTLSARINPRFALAALVAAIRTRAGEVIEGDAPEEGQVIWATGVAGLDDLSQSFGRKVGSAVKGQALLLALDTSDAPQLFVDGLHIIPHDNGTVAVGSTSENIWNDPRSTDDQLEALLERAIAALPMLAKAPVVDRWAALRPRAVTRAPILGAWPGRSRHFIANGGFKIGFGVAPKIAEMMADLTLEGKDRVPDDFRPEHL